MSNLREEVVQEALAFMKANLAEDLTLESVARKMTRTASWMSAAFKRCTGKGVVAHLTAFRIERAKELLGETHLSISEIGFECGFNSATYFTNAFRDRTGVSPSQFRKSLSAANPEALHTGGIRNWFSDSFTESKLSPNWQVQGGKWEARGDCVQGSDEDLFEIRLVKPLPDNFRVSFEAKMSGDESLTPSDLLINLKNESMSRNYATLGLAMHGNTFCQFGQPNKSHITFPARVKPEQWQTLTLELNDDTIKLTADGKTLFTFQDPFPPDYSDRCRLAIGAHHSILQLRKLTIENLGMLDLVPVTRQADSLFNKGLYRDAVAFYLRCLNTRISSSNPMELYFKIGMCFLRLRNYTDSKAWLKKVVTSPQGDVWARGANTGLLECMQMQGNIDELLEEASRLFGFPAMQGNVRSVLTSVLSRLQNRGFFKNALRVATLLREKENVPFFAMQFAVQEGDLAQYSGKLPKAIAISEGITQNKESANEDILQSLLNLAYLQALNGNLEKSNAVLAEAKGRTRDYSHLAQIEVYRALNLRAQGKFDEALVALRSIHKKYPTARMMRGFAWIKESLIECCKGDHAKAQLVVKELIRTGLPAYQLGKGRSSIFQYIPLLLAGQYQKAATMLLGDITYTPETVAVHAKQMVIAGICLELAGKAGDARATWQQCARRYPGTRCYYFGELAEELANGNKVALENMAYPSIEKTELYYLLGLLHQKRDQKQHARLLFQKSIDEDPARTWPVWCSKRALKAME